MALCNFFVWWRNGFMHLLYEYSPINYRMKWILEIYIGVFLVSIGKWKLCQLLLLFLWEVSRIGTIEPGPSNVKTQLLTKLTQVGPRGSKEKPLTKEHFCPREVLRQRSLEESKMKTIWGRSMWPEADNSDQYG